MDCSLPGSSVPGISQAKILEWLAISFARGSSQPRDQIHFSCIGRQSHQGSHYTSIKNNKNINNLDWYCSINLSIRREDDEEQSYSQPMMYMQH